MESNRGSGHVIWITGLSGAGKSSLARSLSLILRSRGLATVELDGDELRGALQHLVDGKDPYGRTSRMSLAQTYARLSGLIAAQGVWVVVSTISLFHDVHAWNRENLANYFEVFLDVPSEELRRRDSKKIYAGIDNGSQHSVTGVDLAAEFPLTPDLRFDLSVARTPDQLATEIVERLLPAAYLPSNHQ